MEIDPTVVGQRINDLRTAAGLRLSDLARATGYSTGYVSQIERGVTLPSLTAMATFALALDVEMTSFIESAAAPSLTVTRAAERHELRLGEGVTYWIHGTIGVKRSFSVTSQHVHRGSEQFRHFGERFLLVLDGSINMSIDGSEHELAEGETIHYGAHQQHAISATSEGPARVLFVSSPAII